MAGHHYETIENNVTGKPVNGATVLVYESGATIDGDAVTSGTLATIYSDDGVTSINQASNPILTDSRGFYEFWTDETTVVLAILYDGSAKKAIDDVEIIGGSISSDVTALTARVDKHDTVFGLSANATSLGTFTGSTISDSNDVKGALQELETAVETNLAAGLTAASIATTNAGSSTTEAVTPDGLAGSNFGTPTITLLVTDPAGAALTTGDGKVYWRVPSTLNGMNLVGVAAALSTASSSGIPTVQIANSTDGVDMLSTKLTIDANETDSSTASTAAVIDTAHDDVATGDQLRIDIDVAGIDAKGLIVEMQFRLP